MLIKRINHQDSAIEGTHELFNARRVSDEEQSCRKKRLEYCERLLILQRTP